MKKILSAILCLAMLLTSVVAVAQNNSKIKVVVDDKLVVFPDQEPVVSATYQTLIPVRGVLEAMGATVQWNQEEKSVYVKTFDGIRRVKLWIDNPVMKKYTVKSVMVVDQEDVTFETAPTIINGRTMIPLRAVSENIDALVDWDQETQKITITTKEYQEFKKEALKTATDKTEFDAKDYVPRLYLGNVTKDDEYTYVDVNIENTNLLTGENKFGGITLTLNYDPQKVVVEDVTMLDNSGNSVEAIISAVNANYTDAQAKYVGIIKPFENFSDEIDFADGTIARIKLSKIAEGESTISIANFVDNIGTSTAILTKQDVNETNELNNAKKIFIDTQAITIE